MPLFEPREQEVVVDQEPFSLTLAVKWSIRKQHRNSTGSILLPLNMHSSFLLDRNEAAIRDAQDQVLALGIRFRAIDPISRSDQECRDFSAASRLK